MFQIKIKFPSKIIEDKISQQNNIDLGKFINID